MNGAECGTVDGADGGGPFPQSYCAASGRYTAAVGVPWAHGRHHRLGDMVTTMHPTQQPGTRRAVILDGTRRVGRLLVLLFQRSAPSGIRGLRRPATHGIPRCRGYR